MIISKCQSTFESLKNDISPLLTTIGCSITDSVVEWKNLPGKQNIGIVTINDTIFIKFVKYGIYEHDHIGLNIVYEACQN